ncbi:hypothetical protein AB4137_00255 [Vibrio breoganii]
MPKLFFYTSIVIANLLAGCVSTGNGGGTTLIGELSSKTITLEGKQYKWSTTERGIISTFEYQSSSSLQESEDKKAKLELRTANQYKNSNMVVTIFGHTIDSVSNGNAKAFLVQEGQIIESRNVSDVANTPHTSDQNQWWNLVILSLDRVDFSKEFEIRVMYTFSERYTNFVFTPNQE